MGRRKRILVSAICSVIWGGHFAMGQVADDRANWPRIVLYGHVYPDGVVEILAGDNREYCTHSKERGAICEAQVPPGGKHARVEIRRKGFKIYSRNLANIQFVDGRAKIDIGTVRLLPSELPTVEQVVRSQDDNGSQRFLITFHNRLARDFLVREVSISASNPRIGHPCFWPTDVILKVENTLNLIAGGESQRLTRGKYRELTSGKNYTIETSGEIHWNRCEGVEALKLILPTSFGLPTGKYTAVHIILPKQFRVMGQSFGRSASKSSKPVGVIENIDLPRFKSFAFRFLTSKEDEFEIYAEFPFRD